MKALFDKTLFEILQQELEKITHQADLNLLRSNYLGKKGPISEITSKMKELSPEEKKEVGQQVYEVRTKLELMFDEKKQALMQEEMNQKLKNETIDVTLTGKKHAVGILHPLTQIIQEIEDLFLGMGYEIAEGPEIENDTYNFEYLNLPKNHPARDMQDSFYFNPELLLRTHTSPVQVRTMLEKKGKPIKIICPGKVYRRDADDATHSHQFMQCEGLVLGEDITFSDLKGTLLTMANQLFGKGRNIRLRPSYFPFTEPSVEVDVSCAVCDGDGCSICKGTGWIEILGAGMVNRNVLKMCGYDDTKMQGFAFGIGIERVAMLKYRIEDIRNFYLNDKRFIQKFRKLQ